MEVCLDSRDRREFQTQAQKEEGYPIRVGAGMGVLRGRNGIPGMAGREGRRTRRE